MALSRNKRPRVYYDSGILVAVGRGPADMHYDDVIRVLDAVDMCGCQGVTTPLALMEAVDVFRKRATGSHKYRSGSDGERVSIDLDVRGSVTNMLDKVDDMKRLRQLKILYSHGPFLNLSFLHKKMLEHAGRTAPGVGGQRCRHIGVGPFNWEHFALALDAGAVAICTTDAAFADIAGNDGTFGHIKIQLTGAPLIDLLAGRGG